MRTSNPDVVYRTEQEKFDAVVEEIKQLQTPRTSVLVGTVSIEKSERLSALLLKHTGIKHVVLNAKYHEKEAEIVAQAGQRGAVTIATNMAGRGTDIVLGRCGQILAGYILSAPNGTKHGASTISFEVAQAAREIQVRPDFIFRWKMI